jgi:phosphate transport system permease protein
MISTKTSDRIATAVLWAIAIAAVGLLGAIITFIVLDALPYLSFAFVVSPPSDIDLGGIGPLLFNSFYMLLLTMLITVPVGVLAGIYMAEYAGDNALTSTIRFAEETISSVPSIVVGLFGLLIFVTALGIGFTALSGALALTVFNLPLMARLVEQSLRAVPGEERDGSLALGATKWQTIRFVVMPLAIPGVVTGIILTAGRVFGEAAALLFTAGQSTPGAYDYLNLNVFDPNSPWSPFRPCTTLAVYIWKLNSESILQLGQEIAAGSAAVLLIAVLLFNVGARILGRRLSRRMTPA